MSDFYESIGEFLKKFWYIILLGVFFIATAILFITAGQDGSYFAIHDNLDLFTPQYQMMRNDQSFWKIDAPTDFLNGISRNVLPSEFSLSTIIYMIFPSYTAYIILYFLKIVIAMLGGCLLAYDVFENEGFDVREKYDVYYIHSVYRDPHEAMALSALAAFAYGILNLFPAFGLAFASIPLFIFLLRKIYTEPAFIWFLLIFLFPMLSYFSYFGIFILGYMLIGIIWMWLKDHEFPGFLFLSWILYAIGSVICEYRLFMTMLFSDEVTIRSTMKVASLGPFDVIKEIINVWANGMMHANDAHLYIVLPVCVIYFFYLNSTYIKNDNISGCFRDYYNLAALIIIFNSVIYGIYNIEQVRNFVTSIIPQLQGFQFNRTVFFNPFLWYVSFFLACYRICIMAQNLEEKKETIVKAVSFGFMILAIIVILIQPVLLFGESARYDDLFYTAHAKYYKSKHNGQTVDSLSYGEFFDTDLFDKIKKEIGYNEKELAVSYGLYPAVLEYNNISTLDGYLGYYPQSYKDKWREVISPALDLQPASKEYFDNSGIRLYLYSGTYQSLPMYSKSLGGITTDKLYIDAPKLSNLKCKYIFSRVEIENAADLFMQPLGEFEGKAYKIYVYSLDENVEAKIKEAEKQAKIQREIDKKNAFKKKMSTIWKTEGYIWKMYFPKENAYYGKLKKKANF